MGTLKTLDEAALQLFIDKDDVQTLRIENEKLREKLRQFNQVDMKKSADLKVFDLIMPHPKTQKHIVQKSKLSKSSFM